MAVNRLIVAGLVLLTGAPALAGAQVVNTQQIIQGGPGQSSPPRDARPVTPAGTAAIRGRVFAADSGRPLRRARIVLQAPELGGDTRSTSTSADGKYELKDLPAGRYTVLVSRSGYLQLRYGQRRPFEQGNPLQVLDRRAVEDVDFTLPRMSLITGRVFDEAAEPISGVRVFAMRSMFFEGRRRFLPVAGPLTTTDDAGQYRILGLAPGSYVVMADLRETWTVSEGGVDQVMGYAPTYFPGTANVADARRVTVGVGQEASNTDLALVPGRTATISGTALDSQGRPLVGRQVNMAQEYRGPGFALILQGGNGSPVAADGTFRMKNVAPGDYALQMRTTTIDAGGTSVQEGASMPIVVSDIDLDNVVLQTSSGWSVSGQLTMDSGLVPTAPRERVRVAPRPLSSGQTPIGQGPGHPGNADSGRVREDWTFVASGVYGAARIRASVPDGWLVKAILQEGRDVTDTAFDMRSGETLSGIQIVLSNRVNSVAGQLVDDKGAPLADGTIIVFAADAEKWGEDSRFVRSVRPDQEGKYQIRGLPPGEYLAVAIDYVEDGMWNDPEYLEAIWRYGHKVTLGESDAQTVALKRVTP